MSENCIFCKIAKGEIPSKKVYEDEEFFVFHDINPAAPVHLLLIPRKHVVSLEDVTAADAGWLGRMVALVPRLAAENGCRPGPEGGFRLVANAGNDGGQEVAVLVEHHGRSHRRSGSLATRQGREADVAAAAQERGADGGARGPLECSFAPPVAAPLRGRFGVV